MFLFNPIKIRDKEHKTELNKLNKMKEIVPSTCRMCHGGCQVNVHLEEGRVVKVTGNPESVVSKGYLCPKGAASPELLYHPDRLTHPLRRIGARGENKWERISWEEAIQEIVEKLAHIKQTVGPQYFALLHGTTRPYVDMASRFCNAYGTPNYVNVAHNCMGPRTMASVFTIGSMVAPVPDAYEPGGITPKCIVLWGSNVTEIGSAQGMNAGIIKRALIAAEKVIVIDPRRTKEAGRSSQWLQIMPGSDGALALAMIHVIIAEDLIDHEFVRDYTVGYSELLAHVGEYSPEWAEKITGISPEQIRLAARTYASVRPAAIYWGSAIDASKCSFQTARAIMILRAITGNIDVPGGDIIPVPVTNVKLKSQFVNSEITGKLLLPIQNHRLAVDSIAAKKQSEFLSGKGVALTFKFLNVLQKKVYPLLTKLSAKKTPAAQLKTLSKLRTSKYPLCPVTHPPTFWKSITANDPYRVQALWIMGSNPLVTMTDPLETERALKLVEFVVVSDFFLTPTAHYADIVLPASMWLEQDDVVNTFEQWCVTNRKKVAQIGETRDDRDVLIEIARKLKLEKAFPWENYRAFVDEMLEPANLDFDSFSNKQIIQEKMRYLKYREQGFNTPSKKVELFSTTLLDMNISPVPVYRAAVSSGAAVRSPDKYPLLLTSGAKSMMFFHSEGRQIKSLRKSNPDPILEINHSAAASRGINDGDWVYIETPACRVKMKARITDAVLPEVVSAEHGWWFPEEEAPDYGWQKSNINMLFTADNFDPDVGSECLRSVFCEVYSAMPGA